MMYTLFVNKPSKQYLKLFCDLILASGLRQLENNSSLDLKKNSVSTGKMILFLFLFSKDEL